MKSKAVREIIDQTENATLNKSKAHFAIRSNDARMMTLAQGSGYVGMGANSFRKWAEKIGARREFSPRLVRYDRVIIDEALDALKSEEGGQ